MAQTIKLKRSGSASATPSSLEHGELAINYADGKIYYKNSSNNIVEFSTTGSFLPLSGGTLTGNLSIANGSVGSPAIRFASDTDTGIFRGGADNLIIATGGVSRLTVTDAGIFSSANVYSGTTGSYRNFGGTWAGTTGTANNGFYFLNTANSNTTKAMDLSHDGNVVFAGEIEGSSLDINGNADISGTLTVSTAGSTIKSPLYMDVQNSTGEGGEITLNGSNSNTGHTLDTVNGSFRIFDSNGTLLSGNSGYGLSVVNGYRVNGTQVITSSRGARNLTLEHGTGGARFEHSDWMYSTDNAPRFYFESSARTFYKATTHQFRNANNSTVFNVSSLGHLHIASNGDSNASATEYIKAGGVAILTNARVLQNVSGNVSMFTNDAGYLTSHQSLSGYLPLSGGTLTGTLNSKTINMQNHQIYAINNLRFNDPGVQEGIKWDGGNEWQIYESPDNQTNASGNLQFASGSGNGTLKATLTTTGAFTTRQANGTTRIGQDGNYGNYGSLGFGGHTNGSNRIFGHYGTDDGLFLASATGRGVKVRTNGGNVDNFEFTSGGDLKVAGSTFVTSGREIQNASVASSSSIAPRRRGTASVNNSGYVHAFRVDGDNLASSIRFTVHGTTGSVVINSEIFVSCNHFKDIFIESNSGFYTVLTVKVVSNGNEDFSVYLKTNSANTATVQIEVFPLNNEVITFTSTDQGFTTKTLEHTCEYGKRLSAEDNVSGRGFDIETDGQIDALKYQISGTTVIGADRSLTSINSITSGGNINTTSGGFQINGATVIASNHRITPFEHVIFGSTTGYIQHPSNSSSNAWAYGVSGGGANPGVDRNKWGLHYYNGSAWSNPFYVDTSGNTVFTGEIQGATLDINGNADITGQTVIVGPGTTSSTLPLNIKDNNATNIFRIRDDGVVLIDKSYLYVTASAGAYIQHSLRARGGITNDGGNDLSINSGSSQIDFNNKNFANVGAITATADTNALTVASTTNATGVEIKFSDNTSGSQNGFIEYRHSDSHAYGGSDVFTIKSDQTALRVLADGLLMFKSGLALKPASGTGAGTTLITSGRALQNITSISSGNITSSGSILTTSEGSTAIKSRFIMGKASGSTANGVLYLQYGSAEPVYIGAGSGGAGLNVGGTVTAGSTIHRGNMTIDSQEIDVSSGDLTLDVAGDITLDADGGDLIFADNGTTIIGLHNDSGNGIIKVNPNNGDLKLKGTGNSSEVTAATFDMSNDGFLTLNDGLSINGSSFMASGTLMFNGGNAAFTDNKQCFFGSSLDMTIKHNSSTGNNEILTNSDLLLDSATNIILDADGGTIDLMDGGTRFGRLQQMIGGLGISAGSTPTFAQLLSSTKTLFFGHIELGDDKHVQFGNSGGDLKIYHDGSNSYIEEYGTGDLIITSSVIRSRTDDFMVNNAANNEHLIRALNGSSVFLYHDGTERFRTHSYGGSLTGSLAVSQQVWSGGNQTASAPAYAFNNDTNTGMFRKSSDVLGFSAGGTEQASIDSNGAFTATTSIGVTNAPTFRRNNNTNLELRNTSTGSVGLAGTDSSGNFRFQLYGDGTNYGFLNDIWNSWDLRKVKNNVLYLNNNTTYYLNMPSTSKFNTIQADTVTVNSVPVATVEGGSTSKIVTMRIQAKDLDSKITGGGYTFYNGGTNKLLIIEEFIAFIDTDNNTNSAAGYPSFAYPIRVNVKTKWGAVDSRSHKDGGFTITKEALNKYFTSDVTMNPSGATRNMKRFIVGQPRDPVAANPDMQQQVAEIQANGTGAGQNFNAELKIQMDSFLASTCNATFYLYFQVKFREISPSDITGASNMITIN
jgi:hypothetical protein